jgi:predicted Zn finger-like uncharacterized protein
MIVQCTHCSTKFRVPDDRVGDAGTKVRCGRCSHTFQVFRSSDPAPSPAVTFGDDLFLDEPASAASMPQTRRASPVMIESLLENDVVSEAFRPPPYSTPFLGMPGGGLAEMHGHHSEPPPSRFPDLSERSIRPSYEGGASAQAEAEELSRGFTPINQGYGGDGGDGLGDIPGLLSDPFASMDMPPADGGLADMGLVIGPSPDLAVASARLGGSSLDLPPSPLVEPHQPTLPPGFSGALSPATGGYASEVAPQTQEVVPKSRGPVEFAFNETSGGDLSLQLDMPSGVTELPPFRPRPPSASTVSRAPASGSHDAAALAQRGPSTGARSQSQPERAPASALQSEVPAQQDRRVWPTLLGLALGTALGVGAVLQFGSQPASRDAGLGMVRSENVRLVHYPTKFGTRLWVVTGEAKNQRTDALLGVRAEVSLHDGPKSLAETKVWLGVELPVNVLYGIRTDADLASAYQAAEEKLQLPVAAVQVLPNASERFMAVFAGIPEDVTDVGTRPAVDVRFMDQPKPGSPGSPKP